MRAATEVDVLAPWQPVIVVLDCQVIHSDAELCPPLVNEARRSRKLDVAAPTLTPAAE